MAAAEILSMYIKKLSHPLKEIRERSLQLLIAKLKLGWELDDELSGTRELLEALLAWFHAQKPSLQREALELLLLTVKTKAGTYIAREFGIATIISNLMKLRHKIDTNALEMYEDVIETLRFIHTVESEDNVGVPRLSIPEQTSSESEEGSSSGYYNLGPNFQSSKETSISNDGSDFNKYRNSCTADSIKVLLLPWVELCPSDKKTLLLIEDALRLLKSTRRCCRFIRDVFLRDFPAEIFLNRPQIIKSLLTISDGNHGGRPGEALLVLLCITRALRMRIRQLSSIELIHDSNKIIDDQREIDDDLNLELEEIAGSRGLRTPLEDAALAALRQLPAPLYALDTLHAALATMARSVLVVDPCDQIELLDVKELNTSLCLVDSLIDLLLDCVSESFWTMDHNAKTYRDISHKSCMVMRLLGDLLVKYRKSFFDDPEKTHHRVAWLRLVMCAEKLLNWARDSTLPPSSMVTALQIAQLDPSVELLYPELSRKIEAVLQNTKTTVEQEYKSKYRELKKLFISIDDAVQFMKSTLNHRSKKVLTCIKNSLPVLELFQSESYLLEIADIILKRSKDLDFDDKDWGLARSIALSLMAHNVAWVAGMFYKAMAEMVRSVLVGDETQGDNETCLTLLYDVGILTEICCHGICSKSKDVSDSASDIMLYLLRGRLVLSEGSWWRLLASLLPVLPLLHVYAEHDTQLGRAVCKSLESDIAECMGVSAVEVVCGRARLLFVRCVAVQLDAAHALCRLLDEECYLPPREALRADVLLNALRRVKPQDFNVDLTSSPSKTPQTTGLTQILDVLKQDIVLDEHGLEFVSRSSIQPTLEPSLRRSTLQQLSVMLRQQDLHDMFVQCDGLRVIVATLRMSLMVDDYLAFPECAISCVSILNSLCFATRHSLAKIPDLPKLLLRVILVFPANDSAVTMTAQVLALVSWSGFALQELDTSRNRVPALPLSVTQRTTLPFRANSYWNTSPNAEHSYVDWVLSSEEWRAAVRVRWWAAGAGRARLGAGAPPPAPPPLRAAPADLAALRAACPLYTCTKALLALENATSHRQVIDAVNVLESYMYLVPSSCVSGSELGALPWLNTRRFLCAPPASARDAALLCSILHFVIIYMDHVPGHGETLSWIKSSFIGADATVISLLSRDQLYPQQTAQESIEVTQLHIHIVKVLLRCVVLLEHCDDYTTQKMESLLKIMLACLERIDLKNFHMLGYLNEVMRCIRYALHSRYCKLSEESVIVCVSVVGRTLSGCAAGGGRKGQACRLDAMLALLALLRQIHHDAVPVQRWSEGFNSDVVHAVVKCSRGARAELRAAALHVAAALAHHAHMLPHLTQAIQEQSFSLFAARIFSQRGEANAVRAAAACLLATIAAQASPRSDVLETDVLEQLKETNFIENCLEILVDFCNNREYIHTFEPNVSLTLLERSSELEVRAQKCGDVRVSARGAVRAQPPPSAALVAAAADALHNLAGFARCPVQDWNDRGLYRLLFRCASWSSGGRSGVLRVRSAASGALGAAAARGCVRATLAATEDCLHDLLATLTPFREGDNERECLAARAQALILIASLLGDRGGANSIWRQLKDGDASQFLHLLLQCLESTEAELQDAGLYCLTQVAQSAGNKKHADKSKDGSCVELLDSVKSPRWGAGAGGGGGAGAGGDGACRPEYLVEELCAALVATYQALAADKYQPSQDERWVRVCSCLSSLLAGSARARQHALHRGLPLALLHTLHAIRDHLSVNGKPADVIRHANNNPVLYSLYWVLTVMDCSMVECSPAKECFAEDNMTVSLCRLWAWCMMTDQLRHAVMHLLYTYNNNCPKAWSSMSVCVCGRTLVGEVCALAAREAARQARAQPAALLARAVHTLRALLDHHHCRAILIKSDALSSMYKLCARERVRGPSDASIAWTRLCCALARHADGGGALLALFAGGVPLAALPAATRARLLPALAHAAPAHRALCLQSPELLELLSGTLLAGDIAELVSAARAVWALAANNHKAKLVLRSAGVPAAVLSALQRLRRAPPAPAAQRAEQLLAYTHTVLHTT